MLVKKLAPLVKKLAPLLLAKFLGFGTESDITRLSYSGFAERNIPIKSKFRGLEPYRSQIIWGRTNIGFSKKVKLPPSAGFGRNMQELGTPKSAKIESKRV